MSRVEHTLKPIYNEASRTLILGSMPSVASRKLEKYYGHPQNRFWKIMSILYDEDISDWKEFILRNHLALWDVIASCEISSSSDASIKKVIPNDLSEILRTTHIAHIFLLGKSAYNLYNKYIYPETQIEGIYLPSPSPANAAKSIEELVESYRIIKEVTE